MRFKWVIALTIIVIAILVLGMFSGFFGSNFTLTTTTEKPIVTITYPLDGATVAQLVMISGTASDAKKTT